jgi:hypothetical protein
MIPRLTIAPGVWAVRRLNQIGAVYFLQGRVTGLIKIGFSKDPCGRARDIAAEASEPMNLLKICHGRNRDHEAALHRHFAHHRELGEWFRPGPDLLAFIATADKTTRTPQEILAGVRMEVAPWGESW